MNIDIVSELKKIILLLENKIEIDLNNVPGNSKYIKSTHDNMCLSIYGDIKRNFDQVIDDISDFIIKNKELINCNIFAVIKKLENLRKDIYKNKWYLTPSIQKICEEIKNSGYDIIDGYVIYDKFIYLKNVYFNQEMYNIPKDFCIEHDFIIRNTRIMIYKTFNTLIYCNGKHPNLSPFGLTFCLDPDLVDLNFNLVNLNFIISSMQTANLNLCYNYSTNIQLFNDIIN